MREKFALAASAFIIAFALTALLPASVNAFYYAHASLKVGERASFYSTNVNAGNRLCGFPAWSVQVVRASPSRISLNVTIRNDPTGYGIVSWGPIGETLWLHAKGGHWIGVSYDGLETLGRKPAQRDVVSLEFFFQGPDENPDYDCSLASKQSVNASNATAAATPTPATPTLIPTTIPGASPSPASSPTPSPHASPSAGNASTASNKTSNASASAPLNITVGGSSYNATEAESATTSKEKTPSCFFGNASLLEITKDSRILEWRGGEGGAIDYYTLVELFLRNKGSLALKDVTVVEELPNGLLNKTVFFNTPLKTEGNEVTWWIELLAAGGEEKIGYVIRQRVPASAFKPPSADAGKTVKNVAAASEGTDWLYWASLAVVALLVIAVIASAGLGFYYRRLSPREKHLLNHRIFFFARRLKSRQIFDKTMNSEESGGAKQASETGDAREAREKQG